MNDATLHLLMTTARQYYDHADAARTAGNTDAAAYLTRRADEINDRVMLADLDVIAEGWEA